MGPDAMILVFWVLSFKPTFSFSSFTFIMRLFSSSSLSAIRVVSSAYLRLLVFPQQSCIRGPEFGAQGTPSSKKPACFSSLNLCFWGLDGTSSVIFPGLGGNKEVVAVFGEQETTVLQYPYIACEASGGEEWSSEWVERGRGCVQGPECGPSGLCWGPSFPHFAGTELWGVQVLCTDP